jgi:NAD(P)-dependent dehydrogenase (short-subunit alcohol dehydrogenase family)
MARTWFITGSSRGLGRALTERLLGRVDVVVSNANPRAAHFSR